MFPSLRGAINLRQPMWYKNASAFVAWMKQSDDFLKLMVLLHQPIAQIEMHAAQDPEEGIFTTEFRVKDILLTGMGRTSFCRPMLARSSFDRPLKR